MNFKVVFVSTNTEFLAHKQELFPWTPGLKDLDFIRAGRCAPVSIDKIGGRGGVKVRSLELPLQEDEARAIGGFEDKGFIQVTIIRKDRNMDYSKAPPLNCFIKKTDRREITPPFRYFIQYELDKEAILNAWRGAGYPLNWEIKAEGGEN